MAVAGCMLAATGLLDSLLWSSIILFSNKDDIRNAGLDQFTFMRTPEGRTLGNIVFVQGGGGDGGNSNGINDKDNKWQRASWHSKKMHQGWGRLGDRTSSRSSMSRDLPEIEQQGIYMDIVTSVVVEGDGSTGSRSRDQSSDRGHDRGKSIESSI